MKSFLLILVCIKTVCGYSQQSLPGNSVNKKPFVLGLVDEIHSSILGEKRTLNIYLPEGYRMEDTVKYPVVYLLDGSADEDFIHVVGLYQFNSFPWINRVPKSVIVGIANVDRQRDFTFPSQIPAEKKKFPNSGKSQKFIDFIEKELQPYIRQTYKANESNTIIGQSLGGLLATEILFTRPSLFSNYIIISPSLWWDNRSLLKMEPASHPHNKGEKTGIYIGVGKEGLTPGEPAGVMEVDANLLAEKIRKVNSYPATVFFDYLPDEDHATVAHQALSNALKQLYRPNDN